MNDAQPSPSVKSVNPWQSVIQTLPPGYKQTDVGTIPEDWEVKALDSVAHVTSGKRLPLGSSLTVHETPHPYIRVTDMRPGTVSLADIMFVPVDVFPAISRFRIFKDDIFISVAGTLGIVGRVPQELDGANLTENADRITNITCSQDFLLHVLMSPLIQTTIDSLQTVGAQPKLALTRIRKFLIPLPPTLAEQQAIAEALSDVDALISALGRLIAKKRAIKQGAMQELLTGRKRLPGFDGEWEVTRFGDAVQLRTDRIDPRQSGVPSFCVELEHIAQGSGRLLSYTDSDKGVSLKSVFQQDDVLFGKLRAYLRKFWLADREGVCSTEIWVLKAMKTRIIPAFLFQLVMTDEFIEVASTAYGTHMPRSDWKIVQNIGVCLPPVSEQTAIAAILSDMDAEIAALERRRDKTRLLKQGMMQELLTGRIRLV